MISPREQLERVRRLWATTSHQHPRLVRNVLLGTLAAAACSIFFGVWFLVSLTRGLPDKETLQRIGDMDQATAVFDRNDKLAFTIFKEQRIEVPLNAISPTLIQAI